MGNIHILSVIVILFSTTVLRWVISCILKFVHGIRWMNELLLLFNLMWTFFSSPGLCELLSSPFVRLSSDVRRPSVNISHCNLLLRNHWADCNQTLVEWSLDGPLPKLCPVIPTSNQDGRQAKNRKKGGWNFNCPLLL